MIVLLHYWVIPNIIAYQFKNYYYTYYANYMPIIYLLLLYDYTKKPSFCTASEASVCKVTTTWSWTPTPPWKRNLASLGAKADRKWGVPGKVVENLGKIMKKVENPRENIGKSWKNMKEIENIWKILRELFLEVNFKKMARNWWKFGWLTSCRSIFTVVLVILLNPDAQNTSKHHFNPLYLLVGYECKRRYD